MSSQIVSPDQESLKNPNKLFAPVVLPIKDLLCPACKLKVESVNSGVVPFFSLSFDRLCPVCLPKIQKYVADATPNLRSLDGKTWVPAVSLKSKPWPLWLRFLIFTFIFVAGLIGTLIVGRWLGL
jgi:hypothetical protein